ncbi:hypothetical protein ACWOC1_06995 [Enterococcus quebecensis]|uniref:hypothetical protein n=1 Tax=Enterococcus quebecensis TaxID=903983 RepID=UPI000AABC736|nr:hypothetical protein [Enterococcus quebecensis]
MNTEERMLEVLQQTLAKIEELNIRLGQIEIDLTSKDRSDHYTRVIEAVENNNIMG